MADHYDEFDPDLELAALPLPLVPRVPEGKPFPIEALGPFRQVATSLSETLQVPISLIAPTILSLASLATQGLANVTTNLDIIYPISLYFIRINTLEAQNTILDNYVFSELNNIEKEIQENLLRSQRERNFLEEGTSSIEGAPMMQAMHSIAGLSFAQFLRSAPLLANSVYFKTDDIEQFIGNKNGTMNRCQINATTALTQFWHGEPIAQRRVANTQNFGGKRLSVLIDIDEDTAIERLKTHRNSARRLLSKALVVWPDSSKVNFQHIEVRRENVEGLTDFNDRLRSLFLRSFENRSMEFELNKNNSLALGTDALDLLLNILNTISQRSKKGKDLYEARCLTANASEVICRLAGVLTIFKNENANSIKHDDMSYACALFWYFTEELVRVQQVCAVTQNVTDAEELLTWLKNAEQEQFSRTKRRGISLRRIQQYGPGRIRSKLILEQVLSVLEDHNWIYRTNGRNLIYVKI